jgi:hypothetical protein
MGFGGVASAGAELQAQTIIQSGQVEAAGARMTAAGLRVAQETATQASKYNMQINEINTNRQIEALIRESERLASRQRAEAASTGFSVASKSSMAVQNETFDFFENAIRVVKTDAENQRKADDYELRARLVSLENQARAADYQAQAAIVLANNRAAEARYAGEVAQFRSMSSGISRIGSLFSGQ